MLIDELLSAIIQLLIFTLIPFIVWVILYRKENFFKWLGLKGFRLQDQPIKIAIRLKLVNTIREQVTDISVRHRRRILIHLSKIIRTSGQCSSPQYRRK